MDIVEGLFYHLLFKLRNEGATYCFEHVGQVLSTFEYGGQLLLASSMVGIYCLALIQKYFIAIKLHIHVMTFQR